MIPNASMASAGAAEARMDRRIANRRGEVTTLLRAVERHSPPSVHEQTVRVVDVDIKFVTLVELFVKAAIAAIPAALILLAMAVFVRGAFSLLG
jgi:hypothetical protein